MSYEDTCTSVSTSTRIVCRYCFPASRGAIPHVLRRIDEYLTPFLCHETFTAACGEGVSVRTLDFLLEHIAPAWKKAVQAAVRGGHMHVLRWMTERQDGRGPWKADLDGGLKTAAAHGHLELVQWLYARGIDRHALRAIDESAPGYVEKSWLYEHCSLDALEAAAGHGHLEVVQWIQGIRADTCWTKVKPMDRAVENGHLTVVQWLYTQTSPERCCIDSIAVAASNGHLKVLQWLESKDLFVCSPAVMNGAAENGHLEVVKWLDERRKVWPEKALWNAVSNGHLEVAKWLDGNCRFDPMEMVDLSPSLAVANGHLDCVQWLDEHFPASFSSHTMNKAAEKGYVHVVKWLHEYRREGCTHMAPINAAEYGHLAILQFLHAHYSDKFTPAVIDMAARNGHLNVVRWLLENRSDGCTTKAMDYAAARGHLEVVLYLLEHHTEGFSSLTMETPQNVEILCLFNDAQSSSEFSAVPSDVEQLKRLKVIFEQRPDWFRGCLRCLVEIAVLRGNIRILDWVNQFGIKLLSTTPLRNAVARGDWRVLGWFHENGFQVLEPDLLELAVEESELDMTRWLSKHGYEIDSLGLVESAVDNENIPLMRWLAEHGPPLSLSEAASLALDDCQEEMTWWLAEADRVQLVLEALRDDERKLLWWLLTRTPFKNDSGRDLIRDAVRCASRQTQLWLQENLPSCGRCNWCFGKVGSGEHNDVAAFATKRRRLR